MGHLVRTCLTGLPASARDPLDIACTRRIRSSCTVMAHEPACRWRPLERQATDEMERNRKWTGGVAQQRGDERGWHDLNGQVWAAGTGGADWVGWAGGICERPGFRFQRARSPVQSRRVAPQRVCVSVLSCPSRLRRSIPPWLASSLRHGQHTTTTTTTTLYPPDCCRCGIATRPRERAAGHHHHIRPPQEWDRVRPELGLEEDNVRFPPPEPCFPTAIHPFLHHSITTAAIHHAVIVDPTPRCRRPPPSPRPSRRRRAKSFDCACRPTSSHASPTTARRANRHRQPPISIHRRRYHRPA